MALWLAPGNATTLHSLALPLLDGQGFVWHRVRGGRGTGAGARRQLLHRLHAGQLLDRPASCSNSLTAALAAGPRRLQVSGVEVRPGERATIYTAAGAVVAVEAAPDGGAPTVTLNSTALPGSTSGEADGAAGALCRAGCLRLRGCGTEACG